MAEVVRVTDQTLSNIEAGNCCELLEECRPFLPPKQFLECANRENICPKSDMVKIRMLDEILDRLARLENHT